MKIFLEKAIFINRAPFDKLELDFNDNDVVVLSAFNGKGKTTILSHIVDAFYEMARPHFNDFNEIKNKLYRISSPIYNLNANQPSFVYLRFNTNGEKIDFLDITINCSEEEYNNSIKIDNKIPFSEIKRDLETNGNYKKISSNFNQDKAKKVFNNNILTYFPSYRYENPGYLNDPYKIKLDFAKYSSFTNYLNNPIEVVTNMNELTNWLMDIILDIRMKPTSADFQMINNLNFIITLTLISKENGPLRFGIGPRGHGGARIQILQANENGKLIYPNIFNLSSGEFGIFTLFGELLKQADKNRNNIPLNDITGIVLIDEIDKHLHIKLQKEVIPLLFNLFPNVQFIVSSHSPFLSMGLAEKALERSKIVDLDNLGFSNNPSTNDLYKEVYNMMIGENERFKEMFLSLELKIRQGTIPLIITEGKTDIQHIKKAKEKLKITDFEIDYFEIPEKGWGFATLKTLLENLCKISHTKKVIGIFDRDEVTIIKDIEKDDQPFKNYGNNVFAFCIPKPQGREYYINISIEFYYTDLELKKTKNGKCLFFDNELNFDSKRKPISSIPDPVDNYEKKIWCENIGELNWIHSKSKFAELIECDEEFNSDFNFSNFLLILNKIKDIINIT